MKKLTGLVLALVFLGGGVFAAEPAMKILGPDGKDITGNMQSLMEDNPSVMMEMSRLFNEVKKAKNAPAESESTAVETSEASAGADDTATTGEEAKSEEKEEEAELFIHWTVKIDKDGKAFLVDEGDPQTSQQYPIAGGARVCNQCTMRKLDKSISETGAQSGEEGAGISGDNFPTSGNGFSSGGFGSSWNSPGRTGGLGGSQGAWSGTNSPGGAGGQGSSQGAWSGTNGPGGYSVSTSGNKVDIGVQDVSAPRLFLSLDATDGRMSSSLSVRDAESHQSVLKMPKDTTAGQFYRNQSLSPFNTQNLAAQGLIQGKEKRVKATGVLFDPGGNFKELDEVVRTVPDAYLKNFSSNLSPDNLKQVKAIYVPENVRLRIFAEASDEDEEYDEIKSPDGKDLSRYQSSVNNLGGAFSNYNKTSKDRAGEVNYAFRSSDQDSVFFPGIKPDSLKWKVVQKQGNSEVDYFVPADPTVGSAVLFRKSDYDPAKVGSDDYNFALMAEVKDLAGNITSVKIPIWVTRTSFGHSTLTDQRDRPR